MFIDCINGKIVLHVLDIVTKGNKNVYFCTIGIGMDTLQNIQDRWSNVMIEEINLDTCVVTLRLSKSLESMLNLFLNPCINITINLNCYIDVLYITSY